MHRALAIAIAIVVTSSSASAQRVPQKPSEPDGLDRTLHLQIRLDRAGFSPGEIDGKPGENTQRAVAAYRATIQAQDTDGETDDSVWQALESADAEPTLIDYTITNEDVSGPFLSAIPEDMLEKAKLEALDYSSPIEALGEKFHASAALLKALNPSAGFASGEQIKVPNVRELTFPAIAIREAVKRRSNASPVTVEVSKDTSSLTLRDPAGKVLFHAPVTTGSEHDPLPLGTWKVTAVAPNPVFNYNPDLFWDADPSHSKVKIPSGPNSPVGVVWIDLTKEHYGIHGTPEPGRVGHSESHGCVRLTNWDAVRVAQLVSKGATVIFK